MAGQKTGLLIKSAGTEKGRTEILVLERLCPALLVEASRDIEGFYLKFGLGADSAGHIVLGYLWLSEYDVGRVVERWGRLIEERN